MDLTAFDETAMAYVELWAGQTEESRRKVTSAIQTDGLLAIWIFDHLPPREENNDRNELAFALTVPPESAEIVDEAEGINLSALADEARERAEIWVGEAMEEWADVLRDVHQNGKLAVWVYDHLPADNESRSRHELVRSLIALNDILGENAKA